MAKMVTRMARTSGKGGFTNETSGRWKGACGNLVFVENLENTLLVYVFILFWFVASFKKMFISKIFKKWDDNPRRVA